ncbi:hypothetical protein BGZ46_001214 [Entomortierella lignicola]|nr:hypothetical protein BGZ46_001214 [Entomortierella lignicola]
MGAHWKREKVQDHKFDFINVDDFVDNSCWRQFRYMLVFVAIMRGILVYCSDIFTAVNLLANSNPNSFIDPKDGLNTGLGFNLPFTVYKYLFAACIVVSFLLLALEIKRARVIIKSRDISYAFTSQIASRYYTVRSYPHYCFFAQINNSKKTVDEVAFFCFFTFRNWKRLMVADAPRQFINATVLYQTFQHSTFKTFFDWPAKFDNNVYKMISIGAMIFTVTMFAISFIMLIAAVILYIPLVSHIRGNLKEYCCHKIDKRIDELILKNTKNRANAAMNLQSKGGKGNNDIAMNALKQPTLPQVDLLDAPVIPVKTPRTAYANTPYSARNGGMGGYGQQKDYGYEQKTYSPTPQQAYNPSPQQAGYTANYSSDDYFQAMPPAKNQKDFDPYAESAFVADDIYDIYVGTQEKQHLQQTPSSHDAYGDFYKSSSRTPSSQTKRYDEYSYQRSASPLPSQHGSDLESNHNSSNGGGGYNYPGGNSNYGGGSSRYGNNGANNNNNTNYNNGAYGGYQGYGNDQYPTGAQVPPRPRRQDTNRTGRSNGGY